MSKTCAWCHKPTNMVEIFAPDIPILDWMEEKIIIYSPSQLRNKETVFLLFD